MQNEKVIETKECKHCKVNFEITDKDSEFYEKISPIFAGKKYNIPTPKLCPDCRQQRRLSFRNERKLYKNKCRASGKDVISIYSPDKPYIVYDQKEWWSDKWDALSYGVDFDFNMSFFEQFEDLIKKVPKMNLVNMNTISENCDYSPYCTNSKNCYLSISCNSSENVHFSFQVNESKDCIDSSISRNCTNCYEIINCSNSYKLFFSQFCDNCSNSWFLKNCNSCKNCFACHNLEGKEYYFLNQSLSKEEYFDKINSMNLGKYSDLVSKRLEFISFVKKFPNKYMFGFGNENCAGDNVNNSKNSFNCFDANGLENCKNVIFLPYNLENSQDVNYSPNSEYLYECMSGCYAKKCGFLIHSWYDDNLFYTDECFNSNNCFGCIGLNNKSYCILNKQYTKEEYEKLVPKIIEHMIFTGEWGEFFPSLISQFGYNETLAQEYFPLTKEEIIEKGFKYKDEEEKDFTGNVYEPLDISEYNENIVGKEKANENIQKLLNGILLCKESKKPFKIIKQELDFYIKHNLPIPNLHSDIRHLNRMKLRNPRKLFDRKCDKCNKEIKSTYSQDREEIVYCEECYNKDVY